MQTSEDLGLTLVQLHGDEGPSFCGEVPRRTGARVIKAAQVAGPGDVRDLERYHVDFHLLDARAQAPEKQGLRGGTGETFDWALIGARRSKVPLILSGGLTGENVAQAIAQTRPFASRQRERHRARAGQEGRGEAAGAVRGGARLGVRRGACGRSRASISRAPSQSQNNAAEDGVEALTAAADSPGEGAPA